MNKEQFQEVSKVVFGTSALPEAIGGTRFMTRLFKRMKVMDQEAVAEVWVGVHNVLCPERTVSSGNSAFAHSPIVKDEVELILNKISEQNVEVNDKLEEKAKRICERKAKNLGLYYKERNLPGSNSVLSGCFTQMGHVCEVKPSAEEEPRMMLQMYFRPEGKKKEITVLLERKDSTLIIFDEPTLLNVRKQGNLYLVTSLKYDLDD